MLTAELIRSLAPRARQDYVDSWVNGSAVLDRWGFNTPERIAALLATSAHETGGWTIVRESFNYTTPERLVAVWPTRFTLKSAAAYVRNPQKLANFVYGARMGNERNGTSDDDGWLYRGGGHPQLTGYANFKACGEAIGVDLAGHPELIEDPNVSLQALCWEMSSLTQYCDMGDRGWKAVCNGINRGNALSKLDPIGWSDRQIWYKRCCDALGGAGKATDDTLRLGDQGPIVKAMQERLAALQYPIGRTDGVYGSRTRAAVLAFQAENHLETVGHIDVSTRAALNSESAVAMPLGERASETATDLKASGSEIVVNAVAIKNAAKGIAAVAVTTGATQQATTAEKPVDLITSTKDVATEIGSWKAIVTAFSDVFAWATAHWWVFAIVAAFAFYRWGKNIEIKRVIDHQLGLNLGR